MQRQVGTSYDDGMSNVALQNHISALKREVASLESAVRLFPDLSLCIDRWGRKLFSSPRAVEVATKVDISSTCGCCRDAPVKARPYYEIGSLRIYSHPSGYVIGSGITYGYGTAPEAGWEAAMRADNVKECIIRQVSAFLQSDPPEYDDYEEPD